MSENTQTHTHTHMFHHVLCLSRIYAYYVYIQIYYIDVHILSIMVSDLKLMLLWIHLGPLGHTDPHGIIKLELTDS